MKKKMKPALLVLFLLLIGVLAAGCWDFDFDILDVEIKPETLNVSQRGRGVITASVLISENDEENEGFNIDHLKEIQVGYADEYISAERYNQAENKLVVQFRAAELLDIINDSGDFDGEFEFDVTLKVILIYDDVYLFGSYTIRGINPENAPDK